MSVPPGYVSNELTHFVGKTLNTKEKQYDLLCQVLCGGWLTHRPHEQNRNAPLQVLEGKPLSEDEMFVESIVCFCDIPVDDLHIHMTKYSRFGLSFLKSDLVKQGASPVFYVAENSKIRIPREGQCDELVTRAEDFNRMIAQCRSLLEQQGSKKARDVQMFLDYHVFSFFKFFDDEKPYDDDENFYLEREWRMVGNLKFKLEDVQRVYLPKAFAERFRKDVPGFFGQITFTDDIS